MSKLAWKEIDWTLVQNRLSRQQRRVYKASMEGKRQIVRALQHRIIGSLDARLLAVKRVTTENRGQNILDIDSVKYLSHRNKIQLAYRLKIDGKSNYVRKFYISRIDVKKKRYCDFDISIVEDKAKQMLAKLALEPEWEAIFEPNSYGFRPGRSYHDAIASVFFSLRIESRFVLNVDIHKCFEEINHDKLIAKFDTFDQMENQIKAWLKAGIMVGFNNDFHRVSKDLQGTPQREILSPLLANVALHGLENCLKDCYGNLNYFISSDPSFKGKPDRNKEIGFSRYADNFIVTAPKFTDIIEIEKRVDKWLTQKAGLKLAKSKTKIVNSIYGFEFLGFQIISIKTRQNKKYKLMIRPSKESKTRIIQLTRKIIQENKSVSSYTLILLLSNIIIGWANYFRFVECQKDFSKLEYIIFQQIRAWAFRRKSKGLKSRETLKEKYYPSGNTYVFKGKQYQNNWILTGNIRDKNGNIKKNFLPKMRWISSAQNINIKAKASPYKRNHSHWDKMNSKHLNQASIIKLVK